MRKRVVSAVALALSAALIGGVPAQATSNGGTTTVSCNSSLTKGLGTVSKGKDGVLAYRQISTSPTIVTNVWAIHQGTGSKAITKQADDGALLNWNAMGSGVWAFKVQSKYDRNCNGISPGNGNTSLVWRISFT